jgi:antitoxin (DNA-binding transcriptional repressor) of toxin-antitoxin stability system
MATFTVHQAKTNLSRLIAAAEAGEEVILARGLQPVVRLVPVMPVVKAKRVFGHLASEPGAAEVLDHGFWDPLPDDLLAMWNGEGDESWQKPSS